ncbi:TadE family type IV pilus minor pilin [Jidongwangia harbinensis]|uniref:TadE family type IV pilus minor pilin n=1 Tax=Jidongwangia harbinensis TaxID=2878561 RepID=UPI001CD968D2|nr:TadE family type IV pilus minor pilin [Jidongwangia harbinensis]MCA2214566.1 pilus assembly protein [Jidongwangia harbinensis]
MTGGRWPGREHRTGRAGNVGGERGSFTAELAAGLPALMLLLLAGLTAVGAVATKAQCVDAARDGALAAARDDSGAAAAGRIAPPGADVAVRLDPESVTVVVRCRIRVLSGDLPVFTVEGRAVAAREPSATGVAP